MDNNNNNNNNKQLIYKVWTEAAIDSANNLDKSILYISLTIMMFTSIFTKINNIFIYRLILISSLISIVCILLNFLTNKKQCIRILEQKDHKGNLARFQRILDYLAQITILTTLVLFLLYVW